MAKHEAFCLSKNEKRWKNNFNWNGCMDFKKCFTFWLVLCINLCKAAWHDTNVNSMDLDFHFYLQRNQLGIKTITNTTWFIQHIKPKIRKQAIKDSLITFINL